VPWVSVLRALPELLWLGWRWLSAWQGPPLLRWLAVAAYLGGATLGILWWLFLLLEGPKAL